MFIGSPWVTNVEDMEKKGLFVTDFALHDATPDMLQVLKTQEIVTNDIKTLVIELSHQKKELMRIEELERFKKLTVERELKMIELKKEIEELKSKISIS